MENRCKVAALWPSTNLICWILHTSMPLQSVLSVRASVVLTLLQVSTITSHCRRLVEEMLIPLQLVYEALRSNSMGSNQKLLLTVMSKKLLLLTTFFVSILVATSCSNGCTRCSSCSENMYKVYAANSTCTELPFECSLFMSGDQALACYVCRSCGTLNCNGFSDLIPAHNDIY